MIENTNARSQDYDALRDVPRPGHADYTAWVKFAGHNDIRGGGQFSGRLTAPLCFAGALAMQLLEAQGRAGAGEGSQPRGHHGRADGLRPSQPGRHRRAGPALRGRRRRRGAWPRPSARRGPRGDSVGGVVECFATGLPAGLGDPMFDGVENRVARALFGIPAVRGVEFGAGFAAADMRGSAHNDPFRMEGGRVVTETNRHGGALGGITSGMPLVVRAAFKPTPSIALAQRSVSLSRREDAPLQIRGRHDPCVVPRAVPWWRPRWPARCWT